jgi:hypothetical protein
MDNQIYIDLMNRQIDGELTPDEERMLKEYLSENKNARKMYEELLSLSKVLERVPQIDPPKHLSRSIMSSISKNRNLELKFQQRWWKAVLDVFIQPKPKTAYAFVFGLILGLIVTIPFIYINQRSGDYNLNMVDLYGTIGLGDKNNVNILAEESMEIGGIPALIRFNQLSNIIWFDLKLNLREAMNIKVSYDSNCVLFSGIKPMNEIPIQFKVNKKQVSISGIGENHLKLFFAILRHQKTTIALQIYDSEKLEYSKEFSTKIE